MSATTTNTSNAAATPTPASALQQKQVVENVEEEEEAAEVPCEQQNNVEQNDKHEEEEENVENNHHTIAVEEPPQSSTKTTTTTLPKATNKVVKEFNSICEEESWHKIYHQIRQKADMYARENGYSTHESERNGRLNRYRDVHPYDHTRIVLKAGSNNYINANLVEVKRAGCKYILTQGPLKETVADFWLMIWEQNSHGILMLNKLMEKGQLKCHKYWPSFKSLPLVFKFNDLKLTVELLRTEQYKNYELRKFKLTESNSKESREITQFHYTTWPDFGVPEQCGDFLIFWKAVRDSEAFSQTVGPAVVHCSAGIGRSGTFCLIDACLTIVSESFSINKFIVFKSVSHFHKICKKKKL